MSQAPFGIVSLAAGGSEGHPQVRERVKKIKKIIYLYLYIYIYLSFIIYISFSLLQYYGTVVPVEIIDDLRFAKTGSGETSEETEEELAVFSNAQQQNMAGMRFSQTANFGELPNPAIPGGFLAHAYDLVCEKRQNTHALFAPRSCEN